MFNVLISSLVHWYTNSWFCTNLKFYTYTPAIWTSCTRCSLNLTVHGTLTSTRTPYLQYTVRYTNISCTQIALAVYPVNHLQICT